MKIDKIKPPDNFILFDNVVLHILILFTIVSALFIFIITPLTYEHINHEFISIIDKFVNPATVKRIIQNKKSRDTLEPILIEIFNVDTSDPEQLNILNEVIDKIQQIPDDLLDGSFLDGIISDYKTKPHALRQEINNGIIKNMCMIIAFLIILAFILNVFTSKIGNYSGYQKHLSVELLIIFGFVMCIEYWFFMNVASKYIPVKPTVIISTFKDTVKDMLKK